MRPLRGRRCWSRCSASRNPPVRCHVPAYHVPSYHVPCISRPLHIASPTYHVPCISRLMPLRITSPAYHVPYTSRLLYITSPTRHAPAHHVPCASAPLHASPVPHQDGITSLRITSLRMILYITKFNIIAVSIYYYTERRSAWRARASSRPSLI